MMRIHISCVQLGSVFFLLPPSISTPSPWLDILPGLGEYKLSIECLSHYLSTFFLLIIYMYPAFGETNL